MNLIFDTGPMLNQLKIIRTICSFSLSPYRFNLIFEMFDLKRVCMKCCKFRFSLLYAKEDPKRPNIRDRDKLRNLSRSSISKDTKTAYIESFLGFFSDLIKALNV